MAALGMPDDHVAHQLGQHLGADLAGESSARLEVEILSADGDLGAAQPLDDRVNREEGRTDHPLDRAHPVDRAPKIVDEGQPLGYGRVHLPVAGHDRLASARLIRHASPYPLLWSPEPYSTGLFSRRVG